MWRNLIKTFERSLILNSQTISKSCFNHQTQKLYVSICKSKSKPTLSDGAANDVEYIVPYNIDSERFDNNASLRAVLRKKFGLTKHDVECIMKNAALTKSKRQKCFLGTLDILYSEGVTKEHIIDNPWLITLDTWQLMEKINLLKSISNLRNFHDIVPLLRIQLPTLRNLVGCLNKEADSVEQGNRIYFIATQLRISPYTVTKHLAKRLFIIKMDFEFLRKNLATMIAYNVNPMSILRDLWSFRYSPLSVELRLKRAAQAKKDKIMPWMVKCPEPILQKSLQLSIDELKIMGDKTTTAEYIGERLGFSAEEAQSIMNKHPQVNSVRVTKIKEVLDYLLYEAQYTRYEIAHVPRILCHSLETTKERIEELKKYGCRPSTLVIVCRSKREYEKFLKQWKGFEKSNDEIMKINAQNDENNKTEA